SLSPDRATRPFARGVPGHGSAEERCAPLCLRHPHLGALMAGNEPLERSTTDRDTTQVIGERTDGASVTRGAARDAVAVQRARFGGIKWGAAFFGWLSANGLAVILIALLSAAGVALGLANN